MNFRDKKHEEIFNELCEKMRYSDTYHQSLAYLIALDTVCRNHISDIYDIAEDSIKTNCINKEWQTSTSKKTIRLAFNLWNGTTTAHDRSHGDLLLGIPFQSSALLFPCMPFSIHVLSCHSYAYFFTYLDILYNILPLASLDR